MRNPSFMVSFSKQELRALEKRHGTLMPLVPVKLHFNSRGELMIAEGPGLLPNDSWIILINEARRAKRARV